MARAETGNVGVFQSVAREFIVRVSGPVFRSERTDNDHSLNKAEELLKQGYGLIVVINHFSLKDPPLAIYQVFLQREMRSKKVVAPIAYDMDKGFYHWLGKMIGVAPKPIVTENTVKKGKENGRKLNDGGKEYFDESIKLLREGGVVVLAPQATRMPHLGQPDKRTVGAFMAVTERNNLDNYAFLFMGLGLVGVSDYSDKKTRGFNFFSKYTVNIGTCLTSQELMERAEGNYRKVDTIVYEELGKIVPIHYKEKVTSGA